MQHEGPFSEVATMHGCAVKVAGALAIKTALLVARHFLRGVVAIIATVPSIAMCTEAAPTLELRARCLTGDPCRFTGETIAVELLLVNTGEENAVLPVEYLRKRGPKIILVDNQSNKETRLCMGPPNPRLRDKLEMLAPGQTIRIPWSISSHDLSRATLRSSSITAIFRFYLEPSDVFPGARTVYTALLIERDGDVAVSRE